MTIYSIKAGRYERIRKDPRSRPTRDSSHKTVHNDDYDFYLVELVVQVNTDKFIYPSFLVISKTKHKNINENKSTESLPNVLAIIRKHSICIQVQLN